ncbi:hypothetical protein HDU83_006696 [Entophlyctis luteolus]|nr:hypothetical protein HDU83_006696 [Entophlyctis luteolus]
MKSLPPLPPALRGHSDSPQQHQPSRNVRPVASSSELFQRLRHFRSMLSFSGSGHNPSTSNVSTPSSSVSQEKGPTHRTSTWSLFAMKRAATTHSASLRKERSQNQSSMHQRSHFNENSSNSRYELRRGVSFGADSAVMYRTISATSRITNSPLASSNSRRTTVTATTSMSSKSYTTSGIPTPVLTSHSPATNHARSSHHPFDALRDATTRIGERQRHAGRELRRLSGNLFGSSSNHNDRNPIHPAPPPPDTWPWVIEESPRSSVRQRRSFDLWMNPSRGRNRAGGGGDLSAGAKSFDLARLATSARDVSEDDSIRAIEFWPPPTPPAGVPVSAAVATRSPLAIAYEDHPATLDNRDRDSFTRIDVRSIAPPPSRVYTVSELRAGKDLV